MIKKLFKFIFKLILFVIILVLIVVGLTLFLISDKTDETPVDKYNDSITMDTVLSEKLSASLDNLGENYSIDLLFDEDSLNNLLYAFIKKTLKKLKIWKVINHTYLFFIPTLKSPSTYTIDAAANNMSIK